MFELMKRRAYVCCLSLFNIYLYFTINMLLYSGSLNFVHFLDAISPWCACIYLIRSTHSIFLGNSEYHQSRRHLATKIITRE